MMHRWNGARYADLALAKADDRSSIRVSLANWECDVATDPASADSTNRTAYKMGSDALAESFGLSQALQEYAASSITERHIHPSRPRMWRPVHPKWSPAAI
jgi:hypothetical protein